MIYFDIETLDFFQDEHIKHLKRSQQLQQMRFGIACTFNHVTDEWREWHSHQLLDLWDYLSKQDICGWNIRHFDLPVIRYSLARDFDYPMAEMDPLGRVADIFDDIRQETGRYYKLDDVAFHNLGRRKISHGQQATNWLRKGNLEKALEYCRDDVALVIALHEKMLASEPILLPARPERGEVEELVFLPSPAML